MKSVTFFFITLLFTSITNATIITTDAGTKFKDLGNSTLDLQTNLEWLDLIETVNRSYNDVLFDINSDGGQFNIADGWRFATQQDFATLVSNFFGSPLPIDNLSTFLHINNSEKNYTNYDDFVLNDSLSVETFIRLLGDTVNYYLENNNFSFIVSNTGAGYFRGFLSEEEDNFFQYLALVGDFEYVTRANGQFHSDQDDIIWLTSDLKNAVRPYQGSMLIRNIAPVPESSTITIFIAALFIFAIRQYREKIKYFFTLSLVFVLAAVQVEI